MTSIQLISCKMGKSWLIIICLKIILAEQQAIDVQLSAVPMQADACGELHQIQPTGTDNSFKNVSIPLIMVES